MAPDPNMGPLPCEPPWSSSPISAVATPLPLLGDPGGPLDSSAGSPTLPAPLFLLPVAFRHFPVDTRGLAGAF